jgi:hypothetical protein
MVLYLHRTENFQDLAHAKYIKDIFEEHPEGKMNGIEQVSMGFWYENLSTITGRGLLTVAKQLCQSSAQQQFFRLVST